MISLGGLSYGLLKGLCYVLLRDPRYALLRGPNDIVEWGPGYDLLRDLSFKVAKGIG